MKFKDVLSELLYDNGLSQEDLSFNLKINLSTINRYFNHNILPSYENILKMSAFFSCSINYLLGFDQENNYCDKFSERTFYDTYKHLLDINNISNRKLSAILGYSRNRMTFWKKGVNPSVETLILIANYFNITIDYLIGKEY